MKSRKRRIGAVDGEGRGCVVAGEIPELGQGMLLVEVHASLISPGTELGSLKEFRLNRKQAAGEPNPAFFRRQFGYQNAGVVLETGEGVSGFKEGDRIACIGSGYALHTDYAVIPQMLCSALPENVGMEEGACMNLALTALNAIRRGKPELGGYLLIAGLGLIGQMSAQMGRLSGAYVMGWDRIPFRVQLARKLGIDGTALAGEENECEKSSVFTAGHGFDTAVLAFGGDGSESLQNIRKVMKASPDGHQNGNICMVGGLSTLCRWGAGMGNLNILSCARTGPGYHDKYWETGEREYPGALVRWTTRLNMELTLKLLSEGRLDFKSLLTHRFPLSRIGEAVDMQVDNPDKSLGIILLPD